MQAQEDLIRLHINATYQHGEFSEDDYIHKTYREPESAHNDFQLIESSKIVFKSNGTSFP